MAQEENLLEDLIASGRVGVLPYNLLIEPIILTIDLDILATRIALWCNTVYANFEPLRDQYPGTDDAITEMITEGVTHMVNSAVWCCYNRLRNIAGRFSLETRHTRLKRRAPISIFTEFPSFLTNLIQTIGPLRIADGPVDCTIIYAPPAGTRDTYGCSADIHPDEEKHIEFISNLRRAGVSCTPVDYNCLDGAFWTTCDIEFDDDFLNIVGNVHRSHYVLDDVVRACFLDSNPHNTPFKSIATTFGYIDSMPVVSSVSALPFPPGVPGGQTAESAGRPTAGIFDINYHGICPGVAANDDEPGRAPGIFLLGRGVERFYSCFIAHQVSQKEMRSLIRDRLTAADTFQP